MRYRFKEINKIEKITDTTYVNDLSVLDDNSYVVNDVCVHNCGCLTTEQTGIGYPMASLIKECYDISCSLKTPAKIVADGGMKKYSDVIKAIALGADYVMLGSIFNKALESAGNLRVYYVDEYVDINEYYKEKISEFQRIYGGRKNYEMETLLELMSNKKLYKEFRGMSTKAVQKSLGSDNLKTSEGIVKYQRVEYTLGGWVENFEHYLRSAMSYTDKITLPNFIGNVETIQISENSFNRYNK